MFACLKDGTIFYLILFSIVAVSGIPCRTVEACDFRLKNRVQVLSGFDFEIQWSGHCLGSLNATAFTQCPWALWVVIHAPACVRASLFECAYNIVFTMFLHVFYYNHYQNQTINVVTILVTAKTGRKQKKVFLYF